MTKSLQYSAVHRALIDTAALYGLVPADVRLLLALADRGGVSRSDVLQDDLLAREGAQLRRSLSTLRALSWVAGGSKRGKRMPITLLASGGAAVQTLRDSIADFEAQVMV